MDKFHYLYSVMNKPDNIIYGLKDPRTDEFRYVGKSIAGIERAKSHLSHSHNQLVVDWISALKYDNHNPDIIVLENVTDWTQLLDKEKYWIGKLLEDGHDLFNISSVNSYKNKLEILNKKIEEQIEKRNKLLNTKLSKSLVQFGSQTDIGHLIKERRKILNITQEDLADISEISIRTLRDIENNKGNPTIQSVIKLLDTLGFELFINLK